MMTNIRNLNRIYPGIGAKETGAFTLHRGHLGQIELWREFCPIPFINLG